MKFNRLVLAASAIVLGACGGGDAGSDTAAPATPAPATPATATPAAGTGTAAPITGTTHEVRMIGDDQGYRFEPKDLTIRAGDGVKWVMVSTPPHNVAFQNVADAVKAQLGANMPNATDLSSPMLMNPNETYTVSFANVPAGKYDYICVPHLAMGMTGSITVQ